VLARRITRHAAAHGWAASVEPGDDAYRIITYRRRGTYLRVRYSVTGRILNATTAQRPLAATRRSVLAHLEEHGTQPAHRPTPDLTPAQQHALNAITTNEDGPLKSGRLAAKGIKLPTLAALERHGLITLETTIGKSRWTGRDGRIRTEARTDWTAAPK
jgi:hypothetical protein